MFDVIFLAKEQKLQVLSFSEQNLMYKVFSDYILYLVGTFSPFSDVTVLMQGLTLKTSSLSMKALIAFCCNLLKEKSGVYWHQEQSEICDICLWDWAPQASSLSSVLCLVTNAITSSCWLDEVLLLTSLVWSYLPSSLTHSLSSVICLYLLLKLSLLSVKCIFLCWSDWLSFLFLLWNPHLVFLLLQSFFLSVHSHLLKNFVKKGWLMWEFQIIN